MVRMLVEWKDVGEIAGGDRVVAGLVQGIRARNVDVIIDGIEAQAIAVPAAAVPYGAIGERAGAGVARGSAAVVPLVSLSFQ